MFSYAAPLREILASLPFVPDIVGSSFCLDSASVYSPAFMTGQRYNCKQNLVLQQSCFMQRIHTADYHEHRDDEEMCVKRPHNYVEWYRGYRAEDQEGSLEEWFPFSETVYTA